MTITTMSKRVMTDKAPARHSESVTPSFTRGRRLPQTRSTGVSCESGQVLPLIAVFMLVVIAFAGFVIDVGNVYRVQQALQASTDAAAAAGAGQLTLQYPRNTANAISQAKNFSSATGGRNPITGVPAPNVTVTVATSCVGSNSNLPCNNANTVAVTQSASVPTFFLSVLGINTIGISTSAKACSPCNSVPLDIQLVVDRTGSMSASGGSPTV